MAGEKRARRHSNPHVPAIFKKSPLVFQEVLNLVMRTAQVEYRGVLIALKYQPQIKSAAAFHRWLNSPEPDARMKVRLPKSRACGSHSQQYVLAAS
jgi:hypothetical protein